MIVLQFILCSVLVVVLLLYYYITITLSTVYVYNHTSELFIIIHYYFVSLMFDTISKVV